MDPEAALVIPVLEGGTDIASMLIFDPAALPDDYDLRARDDPMPVIKRLFDEGCVYWLNTHADGGYSLGVCLGESLPTEFAGFSRCLGVAARFAAPSGRLYFTGIEYAFHHDDSPLRKYPHMGASCQVPPGTYCLTLYELNYPDDFHESVLRQRLSARDFRRYSMMNSRLIPYGCLSTVLAAISAPLFGWLLWSVTALPLLIAIVLPAMLISRSQSYREASRLHLAIQREYPAYCAVLEAGIPT
jgi:hypothetical protein